jgi:hypothetical protein
MEKKREKDPGAVAMAKKRAESLSPARRKEIARKAVAARWEKARQKSAEPPAED